MARKVTNTAKQQGEVVAGPEIRLIGTIHASIHRLAYARVLILNATGVGVRKTRVALAIIPKEQSSFSHISDRRVRSFGVCGRS